VESIEEVPMEEEKDPETLLEERRRKRAEIMAKFQAQGRKENPVDSAAASPAPEGTGTGDDSVNSGGIRTGQSLHIALRSPCSDFVGATSLLKQLGTRSTNLVSSSDTPTNLREPSLAPTPQGHDFDLSKEAKSANDSAVSPAAKDEAVGADAMISAADYDPTQDMKNDREKRIKDAAATGIDAKEVADGVGEPVVEPTKEEDEWEEVEIEVDDEDEELDMFAAFEDEGAAKKKKKITVRRLKAGGVDGDNKQEIVKRSNVAAALQVVDNADDTDGYYRITPGEILDDGRYQVTITLGKGMFSAVVKAKVLKAVDRERRQDVVGKEVAIKVIRSQESM
jgi:serine/threonine-protein kinase PRP4